MPVAPSFQTLSLLGDTLRTLPLAPAVREKYEAQLADARRAYEHTPTNVDSIIWYARRLGYLGQLRESIEMYTRGIAIYPDNPWLYRHRGHRYISVRDFPAAVRDLERATELVQGKPDEIEPDGQPNANNTPIGTLQSNIGYHLALAHYLMGDFTKAATVAQHELDVATNDDRRVSMAHWLYMSLRRSGRDAEAAQVLVGFKRDMNVIENQAYHRLMLLYKGQLPTDSVLTAAPGGGLSVTDASAAYGVANWHWYNGRKAEAKALWQRIVDGGQWGAFGTVAAEAEMARLSATPSTPQIALDGDGLRLVSASGSTRALAFGAAESDVLSAATAAFGASTDRSTNQECGAGPLEFVSFQGGLLVNVQRGTFVGWTVRRAGGPGATGTRLTTMSGIGLGSTRADLESAYATKVAPSSLGVEFSAGGLSGILTSKADTASITDLWAGVNCIAR